MKGTNDIQADLKLIANEIRGLCLDMIAKANSGHLGLPLGCADCAAVLFGQFLRFLPKNPRWINRDRFVLSAGHGSSLLYACLHLSSYDVTQEDLQQFRQLNSKTPGHPEFGRTPGVEATTGPLGQGVGNAVGIALSQKILAAELNTIDNIILDNCTVCLCGDGCLQEGVGQESVALAGLWQLDNLILIYDCNQVTLDTNVSVSQNEDTQQKFTSIGWEVFTVNGHDPKAIAKTLNTCRVLKGKPKLVILKTIIGLGLRCAGTSEAHGIAGLADSQNAKRNWGLDPNVTFFISNTTKRFFEKRLIQLQKAYNVWQQRFEAWCEQKPGKASQLAKKMDLPHNFFKNLPLLQQAESTRSIASRIFNIYAQHIPRCLTGSSDLFKSVKNYIKNGDDFSSQNVKGRNLFFGIREHAMGAILNGIAYDGFYSASGSTFLAFSDYLKPALRVAALSHLPVWYFFSHDSIAVGEDGPTHQPIEQLAGLRSLPNTYTYRPADEDECAACFQCAHIYSDRPNIFILSRQPLPYLNLLPATEKFAGACRGGYILKHETQPLNCLLIATGSEVDLALKTAEKLGESTRVVSMPCCELFLQQPKSYQNKILPPNCTKRIAIEAGSTQCWHRFVGLQGLTIGIDHFGESAPMDKLLQIFKSQIHSSSFK